MGPNEAEMQRLADHLRAGCVEASRYTMRSITRGLVGRRGSSPGTPVDTGEARGGWRVSVGSPSTFKPPSEAPHYAILGDHDIDRAMASMQLGDVVYETDLVDYVGLLQGAADGAADPRPRSQQAPDGFILQAIAEAKADAEGGFRW